jgi:hypothetical protein
MVGAREHVLGFALRPVTPATWSCLVATANAFARGAEPMPADIRDFVWFHCALFPRWRALRPLARRLYDAALYCRLGRPWARLRLGHAGAFALRALRYARSARTIEAIVAETFADAALAAGGSAAPLRASLQAQLEDAMARAYSWPFARTRHTPLAELFQRLRVIEFQIGGAEAAAPDPVEQALHVGYLRTVNHLPSDS